jgi:hypothetical protein
LLLFARRAQWYYQNDRKSRLWEGLWIPAAQKLVEWRKAQGAPELDEDGLEIAS